MGLARKRKKKSTGNNMTNLIFNFVFSSYERYGEYAKFSASKIILECIKQGKKNNKKALFVNRVFKGKTNRINPKESS